MGRSRQGSSVNSIGLYCAVFGRGEVCSPLYRVPSSSVSGNFLLNFCIVAPVIACPDSTVGVDRAHARPCQELEAATSSP